MALRLTESVAIGLRQFTVHPLNSEIGPVQFNYG